MSILSGSKIIEEVRNGNIIIDPFDEARVNPNSYNLRLGNKLLVYDKRDYDSKELVRLHNIPKVSRLNSVLNEVILDSHIKNPTKEFIIPEEGFMLQPGILYLASTVERTYTDKYVPTLNGRSSTGRLSMTVHMTAGFGDVGFDGRWTLEIMVLHNLIVYPNDELLQVAFETLEGNTDIQYNGKYNHQVDVAASKFWQDVKK